MLKEYLSASHRFMGSSHRNPWMQPMWYSCFGIWVGMFMDWGFGTLLLFQGIALLIYIPCCYMTFRWTKKRYGGEK